MIGASKPLLAGGAKLSFSWLTGIVLATDQRSDSYTSGGGRTVVIDGSGGGSTSVSTRVVVSRDIWIKDDAGMEHHVRVTEDIPVRVGQEVAFIYCKGEAPIDGNKHHEAGGLMSVYVISTNKAYSILSPTSLTKQLLDPPVSLATSIFFLLLWVFSFLLIAIFGVGLLALAALGTRSFIRSRRLKERSQAVMGELQAEHQRLLNTLYSDCKKQLAQERTVGLTQPLPEVGA